MKCAVYQPLAVVLLLSLVNGASPPSSQPAGSKEEATSSTRTVVSAASYSSSSSSPSSTLDAAAADHHQHDTSPSRRGSSDKRNNKKINNLTIKKNIKKEPLRPSSRMHPDGRHIPERGQHKKPDTNRCWDFDLSLLQKGMICGSPLSYPCFDFGRCQSPPAGSGPTMYVYDHDCTLSDSRELPMLEEEVKDGRHIDSHWRKVGGWSPRTYSIVE